MEVIFINYCRAYFLQVQCYGCVCLCNKIPSNPDGILIFVFCFILFVSPI